MTIRNLGQMRVKPGKTVYILKHFTFTNRTEEEEQAKDDKNQYLVVWENYLCFGNSQEKKCVFRDRVNCGG